MTEPKKEPKQSSRHLARKIALQGLYQWRMTGNSVRDIEQYLSQEIEDWSTADRPLAVVLLRGAAENAPALEAAFSPHLDRPINELSPIEAAILLLATYELTYRIETPYRVILNEAIELCKEFGGTDGHRYVNGVLDKLAVHLRAAEVQDAAKNKAKK